MDDCNVCEKRGICCNIEIQLEQNGIQFFNPYPFYTCVHLDLDTGKCKNYENRPEECKKYQCNGNHSQMHLFVKGESKDERLIITPERSRNDLLVKR